MRLRWLFAFGVLAAGCEVHVGECDKDDAGRCEELFPSYDAAVPGTVDASGMDAATDGAARADANAPPVDSAIRTDAANIVDSGLDATQPDASMGPLTDTQFCERQFAPGRAWSELLGRIDCNCLSSDDQMGRDSFLAASLRYTSSTISDCLDNVARLRTNGVTVDASKTAACADRFASQFKGPDQFQAPVASCGGGFDIAALEAQIGHGRQAVAQLPECRAALVGTKAFNAPCADSLECSQGLRCRPVPGGGASSCQMAAGNTDPCTKLDDCADGHVCSLSVPASGTTPAQFTCIRVNDLKLQLANCQTSSECAQGLLCDVATKKCANPTADRICD